MSKPFKFKQFSIWQDQCAMKVGTDGVLLGCFANPTGYTNCLDIGTGTGLLALMMAQKDKDIAIQAIEVDESVYKQAKHNVNASEWRRRVEVANISLQQFIGLCSDKFDFIIANPPYYQPVNETKGGNLQKQNPQRKKARATGELDYDTLIKSVGTLLSSKGIFNLVIPYPSLNEINELLNTYNLFINRVTNVKSYADSPTIRVLVEISRNRQEIIQEELTIYATPNKHTQQYINYTNEFYPGTGKYFS